MYDVCTLPWEHKTLYYNTVTPSQNTGWLTHKIYMGKELFIGGVRVGVGGGIMKGTWRRTHANIPQVFVEIWKEQLPKVTSCCLLLWRSVRTELGKSKLNQKVWCYFDRASSLIFGNKMTTRCNRGFYCRSYCLLNMFRASPCPSSGAQEYYTVVAACGILCCGFFK